MRVKLLIVDDEILQLGLIGRVVARFRPEYEITTTHEPKEALRQLTDGAFDAVLTDIRMPDMDGIELIRRIREMDLEQPEIMILSGFDDFHYAKTAISCNVLEYILKPVDSVSLENALSKLEKRLTEKRSFWRIQDSYHAMEKQRMTTALFKLANNLELNVQESVCVEALKGGRLRLLYLEGGRNGDCAGIVQEEDYVEELSKDRYLIFQRMPEGGKEKKLIPPKEGCIVASLPCRLSELASCWEGLEDYADTCRWLGRNLMIQQPHRNQVLLEFADRMAAQQPDALRAMQLPLAVCLRNGELTRSEIWRTIRSTVEEMRKKGITFGMYPNRQEELGKVLEKRFAGCSTIEEVCALAAQLAGSGGETQEEEGFAHNVRVYLEAHYDGECSLEHISGAFGYSAAHFSRLFTAAFGSTYTRYLSEYRLERASEFLKDTDIPVSEVARRVGITDPGYFTRQFSKKYHTSPAKFRKIYGEGIHNE